MTDTNHVVVRRLDGGPTLVIEDATALAGVFFTKDASSAGSYFARSAAASTASSRI
jgi:hypothetical protein